MVKGGQRYTLRWPADLKEKVRTAVAKRHLRSAQDAIFEALDEWLPRQIAEPPKDGSLSEVSLVHIVTEPSLPVPSDSYRTHPKEHAMLEEILQHGDPEAGWITGNLTTFVEKIRAVPDRRKKQAANGR